MFRRLKAYSKKLKKEVVALYIAYKRGNIPWYAKVFVGIVIAYAFSPIDLIPDFIPILGYIDDLILIPIGIKIAIKLVPEPVMLECRQEAENLLKFTKPRNWKAAVVIIFIWIVLTYIIISKIIKSF